MVSPSDELGATGLVFRGQCTLLNDGLRRFIRLDGVAASPDRGNDHGAGKTC